jgi:hypothetical protein
LKPRQDAVSSYSKDFKENFWINSTSKLSEEGAGKIAEKNLGWSGRLLTLGKNTVGSLAAGTTAYNIERGNGSSKSDATTKALIVSAATFFTGSAVSIASKPMGRPAGETVQSGLFGTSVNSRYFIGNYAIRDYQTSGIEGFVEGTTQANVLYLESLNNNE